MLIHPSMYESMTSYFCPISPIMLDMISKQYTWQLTWCLIHDSLNMMYSMYLINIPFNHPCIQPYIHQTIQLSYITSNNTTIQTFNHSHVFIITYHPSIHLSIHASYFDNHLTMHVWSIHKQIFLTNYISRSMIDWYNHTWEYPFIGSQMYPFIHSSTCESIYLFKNKSNHPTMGRIHS